MNKQLLYIPFFVIGLVACSSTQEIVKPVSQHNEESKTVNSKSHKRKRKILPEGVISVDIASYDNRLHLLTGEHHNGQRTLWYQYSKNGGVSWSVASKIFRDNNLPVRMTRGNDAQITVQGENIVIAWTKFDQSVRFNAGSMLAARSTDEGVNWEYTTAPPDWNQGPHGYIDLASDEHAMHAVWLDSRKGRSNVKASQGLRYARSTDGGLHWQTNVSLDNLTCSCCWNTINTDKEGNAYVLYRDKNPSDLSMGLINAQQQWQRLSHVGAFNWQFDGCPHIGGGFDFQNIAATKRLHAIVGTGHPEHLGVHYVYSDDAGKTWSPTKQFGDESAIHADIASHDNGRVLAVWDMMSEDGLAIFMAESNDQGISWSQPSKISNDGMRATHPVIIKTEQGFLAVWTENDGQQQTLMKKIL